MKNKRLCALLLTIAMCFCFVSCSGNTQTVDNNLSTTSQTEAVTQAHAGEDSVTTEAATTADKESTTAQSTSKAKNENKEKENRTTVKITASKTTTKKNEPTVKDEISCTINVECKSILNNMDKLKDGHSEYVPADGYIVTGYKYTAKAGFTAYDVLKKACEDNGIKLTSKSSMYGTYVSGINNIDEFDCGSQSGWMFSINGNRPNVSASNQKINDGDEITFEYVCEYQ